MEAIDPTPAQELIAKAAACARALHENATYVEGELANVRMSASRRAEAEAICRSLLAASAEVRANVARMASLLAGPAPAAHVFRELAQRSLGRGGDELRKLHSLVQGLEADAGEQGALAHVLVAESAVNVIQAWMELAAANDGLGRAAGAP